MRAAGVSGSKTKINFSRYNKAMRDQTKRKKPEAKKKVLKKPVVEKF